MNNFIEKISNLQFDTDEIKEMIVRYRSTVSENFELYLQRQITKSEKKLQKFNRKLKKQRNLQYVKQELQKLKTENNTLRQKIQTKQKQINRLSNKSELLSVPEPTFVKIRNPISFFQNTIQFLRDKNTYTRTIHHANKIQLSTALLRPQVLPDAIIENDRDVQIGNRYRRIYYLADIPSRVQPFLFFKLIASTIPFQVVTFVKPIPAGVLLKKAKQRISVLQALQYQRQKRGLTPDPQVEKQIEETKSFSEDITYEREKGIAYSGYLMIEGESKDEVDTLHRELKTTLENLELTANTYVFGQKQAFKAFLPVNTDVLKEDRIIQSSAASYLMPFVAKPLYDPDGIFLGINAYHDTLVFINPFTPRNNNINIFGVSGAGKSVTSKLLASRLFMRGVQVIIIDPEGEYVDLARKMNGEVIQFGRNNGINPFAVVSEKRNDILDHISVLKTFFKFFIPDSVYDSAILDSVLMKLYEQGNPTFTEFLQAIKENPMHEYVVLLDTGSLQGIFNATRDIQLNNDFLVFDISKLSETEVKAPAMYLLTCLIWNLVKTDSEKKRMLFIDEAHTLLIDESVAVFYREVVKQARKRNLGVVSITQDVEDFLDNEFGKAIITNSETKILLKQSHASVGRMKKIFPVTEDEKLSITSLQKGEVILFRENEHIRCDIHILPHEKAFVYQKQ